LLQIIEELKLSQDIPVYCDSAEPDRIVELQNAGINAKKANKSVRAGIDFIRGVNPDQEVGSGKYTARKLFITKDSVNTRQEISQYKNKEGKNGQLTDEPVKFMDHAMDAARYGSYTHYLEISAGVDVASIIDTLY
jgi:phage terminase large subunit